MFKLRLLTCIAFLLFALSIGSCVRSTFDTPPDNSGYDPQLTVTHTIAQLRAMNGVYVSTTSFPTTVISEDVVVTGIVTADDRSGNYYKQIVIQDATSGIAINVSNYSLYTHYPIGRKLYIKCKGLTLGYDGGLPVLGLGITPQKAVQGLESSDIDDHIIKASIGHFVKDTVITLTTANLADPFFYNRLVTVKDVEFADSTLQYTDSSATTNRNIVNCAVSGTATFLVTRNSNFSNFHFLKVPSGHGSITGIFTVYASSASRRTAQIVIRDTSDVKFYEPRCTGGTTPPPPGGALLQEQFNGGISNTDIAITGWANFSEAGTVKWKYGAGGAAPNKPWAQISAYSTNQADVKTWLIPPGVDLTGATAPKLIFLSTDGYDNGALLTVLISTNYVPGSNPNTATWTILSPNISTGHATGYGNFISSGQVNLSSYIDKTVYIAFKYIGSAPSKTTTYQIDDITVTKD